MTYCGEPALARRQKRILHDKRAHNKSAHFPKAGSVPARVIGDRPQVVVVGYTVLYRYLARTWVGSEDVCVEFGSAYGHCTAAMHSARAKATGVDISSEAVSEASKTFPSCTYVLGNILAEDAVSLGLLAEATVVFIDIGGNRDYASVASALRLCLERAAKMRLIVIKSRELRQLLLQYDTDASCVARSLQAPTTEDEIASALMHEVKCRGGQLPIEYVYRFSPRLRYHIGKGKLLHFISNRPEFEMFTDDDGPRELQARIRLAEGTAGRVSSNPLGATSVERAWASAALAAKVRKQFNKGVESRELGELLARLRWRGLQGYVANLPDSDAYAEASDEILDPRRPAPWSDAWQNVVAMRHLHLFLHESEEFSVAASPRSNLRVEELRSLRVTPNHDMIGAIGAQNDSENARSEAGVLFQVIGAAWNEEGSDQVDANLVTELEMMVPL
eukprot:TRINITY_DN20975_c0_g1_i1.p1 TRINITY_DN20975_c0_g1~~TRINITY_DN20975_c0_g1_i1.p1  ORF type:complete len:447 (+),score=40.18 TRINITY_DN20975_c0_g1_i1:99-1439(+)